MRTTTIDQINHLSAERSKLRRLLSNGHRGEADVHRRVDALTHELDALWEQRRRERAGRPEGIDLLIDRAYERLYGGDFDDAVAPPRVGAVEDGAVGVAHRSK